MAGIVGLVRNDDAIRHDCFRNALRSLCHHSSFVHTILPSRPPVLIGATYRPNSPPEASEESNGDICGFVYGFPVSKRLSWKKVRANEIIQRYMQSGPGFINDLDGTFFISIIDYRNKQIFLFNDRTGSLPVCYAGNEKGFSFAPEAKAIFPLLVMKPDITRESMVAFLNLGYPIADQTMFDSVKRLEPGHFIRIDIGTSRYEILQYWNLAFSPRDDITQREAVETFDTIIRDVHTGVLSDDPDNVQLLLTGGLDSRVILGTMNEMGRTPDTAMTWGVSQDIRDSDPYIARILASRFDVPFEFLRYDAETILDYAREWVIISELSSDNAGNFAAGGDFIYRTLTPGDVVLIGDQMIGPGGFPVDASDAVSNITKIPKIGLSSALSSILKCDGRDEPASLFKESIERVLLRCENEDPKDIQDYMFFHLYVFRWLFADAYFREPMVTVRRPFLMNPVLEFTSSLPRWLRVDKRVLVSFLRWRMPGLSRLPLASADSLIDWNYHLRTSCPMRDWIIDLVDIDRLMATPLGEYIDPDKYISMISGFFSRSPEKRHRAPEPVSRIYRFRRILSRSPAFGRMISRFEEPVKTIFRRNSGTGKQKLIWRLALISLLQETIESNTFGE